MFENNSADGRTLRMYVKAPRAAFKFLFFSFSSSYFLQKTQEREGETQIKLESVNENGGAETAR
jgi:hypothetical protein